MRHGLEDDQSISRRDFDDNEALDKSWDFFFFTILFIILILPAVRFFPLGFNAAVHGFILLIFLLIVSPFIFILGFFFGGMGRV